LPFLLGGILFYALGVGIARYLGHSLNVNVVLLGQLWVTLLQVSVHYLNDYFDYPSDLSNPNRTTFTGGSGVLGEGEGKLRPQIALLAAACTLTGVALASFALARLGAINSAVLTVMLITFALAFFYSVPPVRLATSGYGELGTALVLANLLPALGFSLQTGELHRLLAMSTFPLTALTLASMLSLEFPDYANDVKIGKRTLFVRAGWENAVKLHHAMVAAGYLLLLASISTGLPFAIGLPALFTLPLAGLQVWYINRIAAGLKPNWFALTLNGVAFTFATAYLLAYGFWTR
jgi:1,4-dihydroxy-2-naphthoate octaprenyltransferase